MTKTLIDKGYDFWDKNKRTLKIIGISFVVIFSIKSIGDSIYKAGFNCIEDTIERKRSYTLDDEIEKKERFRQAKFICLEKIHGWGYRNRKHKEYLEKYSKMNSSMMSGDEFRGAYPLDFIKFKRVTLYHLWGAWEYIEGRYPEESHFDQVKFERYLMKIKDRKYDGSENLLKLTMEDAEELGF